MNANIAPDIEALAVPIEKLERLPGNPHHGDVEAVKRSYERFGQRKPVVAVGTKEAGGFVSAGNTQLDAATELGWTHLAVVWTSDSEEEAKAFALADNRTSVLGYDDEGELLAMLESIKDSGQGLEGVGFSEDDLADLRHSLDRLNQSEGSSASERQAAYERAGIRSIVLPFAGPLYEEMIVSLAKARAALGVDSNSELVHKLVTDALT